MLVMGLCSVLACSMRPDPDLESSISGIENEEVDLSINPLTITPERLKVMNFSQPYFISGTTLAMRKVNSWTQVVRNIFT